jgi:chromosome segregation ATPase
MDDSRFSRLENRVDEIKDDVAEIKAEQKVFTTSVSDLKDQVKDYTEAVNSHVTSDNKVITVLERKLEPILKDFEYKREREERRTKLLKLWGMRLGVVATLGTILKIWFSF